MGVQAVAVGVRGRALLWGSTPPELGLGLGLGSGLGLGLGLTLGKGNS